MPIIIRFALAISLLLECGQQIIPNSGTYLPIAGSHFAQLGLVVILAVAAIEITDLFKSDD